MKASATAVIDRPIEDVFAYVSDVENMDEWVVGVGDTRLVDGDGSSVGDRYESTYTYAGDTTDMRFELTAYEPPSRLGITAPEGPFAFDGLLELEEVAEGTLVRNTIETDADGAVTAFLFTALRPVMRWVMARRLASELSELEAILEDGAEAPRRPDHGATRAGPASIATSERQDATANRRFRAP